MVQTPDSKDKTEDEPVASLDHGVQYKNMGIWRIASLRKDYWWKRQGGIINGLVVAKIAQKIKALRASASVVMKLMRDIWDVAPFYFFCWLVFTFAGTMETTIDLYVSTYTLEMVFHSRGTLSRC